MAASCLDTAFILLSTLTLILSKLSNNNWDCETKSVHWNEDDHHSLTSQCGEIKMTYSNRETHCAVQNATIFRCMTERAQMHDEASCSCYIGNNTFPHFCLYAEVCAFVDPGFQCGKDYSCNVSEYGKMNCITPRGETYKNDCTRGIIFCPKSNCYVHSFTDDFYKYYSDKCRSTYEDIFGKNQIVYYIDKVLFNKINDTFGHVHAMLPLGYDNPCKLTIQPSPRPSTSRSLWAVPFAVVLSLILMVIIPFCLRKVRKKRAKTSVRWRSIVTSTSEYITRLMENIETERDSGENPDVVEDVFPIVPDTFVHPQPTASPNVYVTKNQPRHPTSNEADSNPADIYDQNSSETRVNNSQICQHSGHDWNVMSSGILDQPQVSEIASREVCDDARSVSALDSRIGLDLSNRDVGVYENVTYGHAPVEDAYMPKSCCSESNDIA